MPDSSTLFQYCPKLVVVRDESVLLCRRTGEEDLNDIFTFIGGKMEHTDGTVSKALRRESREEVGASVRLSVLLSFSKNVEFSKRDGTRMILPHYLATYLGGRIDLSTEYSEYRWVKMSELGSFEPKVDNAQEIAQELTRLLAVATATDFLEL